MSGSLELSDRIRDAIGSESSAAVAAILLEVESGKTDAEAAAAAARTRSLDPLLKAMEVQSARMAAVDAEFIVTRLATAETLLRAKQKEFAEAEAEAARAALYEAAREARDAAVKRLAAEYPDLAARLGQLLAAVVLADDAVEAANRQLPSGAVRLEGVEQLARGFGSHQTTVPRLVQIGIPGFEPDPWNYVWRPFRRIIETYSNVPPASMLVGTYMVEGTAT